MDGFEQVSAEAGSGQNDGGLASEASSHGSAADETFLARAAQWCEEALRHPDHRQACIGAVTSGLAKIIHTHEKAIERGIESCEKSLLLEPSIQKAITAQTGLFRQWHSTMSFAASLEKIRRDAEKREAEGEWDPLLRTPR